MQVLERKIDLISQCIKVLMMRKRIHFTSPCLMLCNLRPKSKCVKTPKMYVIKFISCCVKAPWTYNLHTFAQLKHVFNAVLRVRLGAYICTFALWYAYLGHRIILLSVLTWLIWILIRVNIIQYSKYGYWLTHFTLPEILTHCIYFRLPGSPIPVTHQTTTAHRFHPLDHREHQRQIFSQLQNIKKLTTMYWMWVPCFWF